MGLGHGGPKQGGGGGRGGWGGEDKKRSNGVEVSGSGGMRQRLEGRGGKEQHRRRGNHQGRKR